MSVAAAPRPRGHALQVWDGLVAARTAGLAAEVAFFAFTSLIPLAAVLGLLTAKLAANDTARLHAILDATPPAMRELLEGEFRKVSAWNGGAVAPMAAVVFVALASTGLHAIFDGLEAQTGASRPWWQKRLYAIATCLALSAGAAALTLLLTGLGGVLVHVESASGISITPKTSLFWRLVRALFAGVVSVGLVAGLYFVGLPKSARKRMPILPGAVFATAGHWVLGYGYGGLLSVTGAGGAYLAGLAAVGVTLTSLYLSAFVLLVGVEINEVVGSASGLLKSEKAAEGAAGKPAESSPAEEITQISRTTRRGS